jgi:heme o synthase
MKPATDISDLPETLLLAGAAAVPIDGLPDVAPGREERDVAEGVARPRAHSLAGDFYELTKPRMNFLVVATTLVGYAMATRDWSNLALLAHTLAGTMLTAAGASVLNQYVERRHDRLMVRTQDRPLAAGRVSPPAGLAFGVLLAVTGLLDLAFFVNPLTALLGAVTLATYVFLYTPLKRVTTVCTIVGAVPGAIPPMMGVAAAAGELTAAAWLLFAILFVWQMPHFLAIAILYRDDYARGGFKMLPVVDEGLLATGRQIVVYSSVLIPVSLLPSLMRVAGGTYFVAALVMGTAFLGFGVMCALTRRRGDARQLFFASIIYLPALLGAMMIDRV